MYWTWAMYDYENKWPETSDFMWNGDVPIGGAEEAVNTLKTAHDPDPWYKSMGCGIMVRLQNADEANAPYLYYYAINCDPSRIVPVTETVDGST